jgi:tetratricopeptide (TPR) repeat protein
MRNRARAFAILALFPLAAVAGCRPQPQELEAGEPTGFEPTTSSAEARTELMAALDEFYNVNFARAAERAASALALDSTFGLARALNAANAPGLGTEDREAALDRAVTDAAKASPVEMAIAASMRARAAGRIPEARGFDNLAVALMPGDPRVLFFRAFGMGAEGQIEALREITARAPDFAPPYNILAYQLWAAKDTAGALQAVQRYVELMPSHPNAHDSYAEIVQFAGRYQEALDHYQQALSHDAGYLAGYTGVAEANLLMGKAEEARAAYAQASERSPTPAGRFNNLVARAVMHVVAGTPAAAVSELMTVARDAQAANQNGPAAAAHRNAALVEAVLGNPAAAAGHLAPAERLAGNPPPTHHRITAIAQAVAGRADAAAAAAERFEAASDQTVAAQREQGHEVRAIVAIATGDLARARSELGQAGSAPLGKALLADALADSGDAAGAQALKDEVTASRGITAFDVVARARAARR